MEIGCEDARSVDTGLVLGLGRGRGWSDASRRNGASKPRNDDRKGSSSLHRSDSTETSLTLGRHQFLVEAVKPAGGEEQRNGHPSSPQSMASSLSNNFPSASVRRKDADAERAMSSRASDEDEEASAKKKLRLTKEQSALLEERFTEHTTLNPKQKMALAKQLNLRPRQVEVWFQNRRARTKLKQTEIDCEYLKKCCESLTNENRRLQKEVQQLRALGLSAPAYMQISGAPTLSLCPSCEKMNGIRKVGESNDASSTIAVARKAPFLGSFTHSPAAC